MINRPGKPNYIKRRYFVLSVYIIHIPLNMTTSKTAIIKCGVKAQEFNLNIELHPNTIISKLYIPEEADATFFKNRYPQAEIVDQKEFILDDELIDHVIIYTPEVHDMPLIQAVLQSGKNVQIMHN